MALDLRALSRTERLTVAAAVALTVAAGVARLIGPLTVATFLISAVSLAALAALVGQSIEQVGERMGPGATGLLQSALGNLPELLVGIFALRAGLVDVVQAALVGSILANTLLVLGVAVLAGGLRHGTQRFSSDAPRMIGTLLLLAVAALLVPTLAARLHTPAASHAAGLSSAVALILIAVYALSIPFWLRGGPQTKPEAASPAGPTAAPTGTAGTGSTPAGTAGTGPTSPTPAGTGANPTSAGLNPTGTADTGPTPTSAGPTHETGPNPTSAGPNRTGTADTGANPTSPGTAGTGPTGTAGTGPNPAGPNPAGTGPNPTSVGPNTDPTPGTTANTEEPTEDLTVDSGPKATWPLSLAITLLCVGSLGAALASDWFVGALEPATKALGLSQTFTGLVIVAIASNAVENVVGVRFAWTARPEYALSTILNSPLQIALLLTPLLVLISRLTGPTQLTLVFPALEVAALALATVVVIVVLADGEYVWLEGVALIGLYCILAAAFWWG